MLRPATPGDRAALLALVLAEDAAYSGAAAVSTEEAGAFLDGFAPGVVFDADGRPRGYAAVSEGGGTLVLVDPADDPGPALDELVAWLREQGADEVHAYAADARRIAWLEARGYRHRRSAFDLERGGDPPPASALWPPGVAVERHRPGPEDAAVHALIYLDAAWTEVPGHTARSLDAWRASVTSADRGWVARRDGRPVGWVVGRVFGDGRGWIDQLAVARSERGIGLGRALLLHALDDLRAHGATMFALGVQGANEAAVGLYRAAGFVVTRQWRTYA
jgi:ribosomal protein S18 acetylase RimI-like enzyme